MTDKPFGKMNSRNYSIHSILSKIFLINHWKGRPFFGSTMANASNCFHGKQVVLSNAPQNISCEFFKNPWENKERFKEKKEDYIISNLQKTLKIGWKDSVLKDYDRINNMNCQCKDNLVKSRFLALQTKHSLILRSFTQHLYL